MDTKTNTRQPRPGARFYTDVQRAEVLDLYRAGLTYAEILKRTGVSRGTVHRYVTRSDAPLRLVTDPEAHRERRERLARMRAVGMTCEQIAAEVGICADYVYRILSPKYSDSGRRLKHVEPTAEPKAAVKPEPKAKPEPVPEPKAKPEPKAAATTAKASAVAGFASVKELRSGQLADIVRLAARGETWVYIAEKTALSLSTLKATQRMLMSRDNVAEIAAARLRTTVDYVRGAVSKRNLVGRPAKTR